jgi:hypothetical protein
MVPLQSLARGQNLDIRLGSCDIVARTDEMQARERHVAAAIAVMRAGAERGILGRMKAHTDRLRDVKDGCALRMGWLGRNSHYLIRAA